MKKILIFIVCAQALLVTGCSKWIPHYKIDIEQGNILTRADVNKIRPGMTRAQVKYILGTPLIVDAFHQTRWDYVYTFKKGNRKKVHRKRLSLFFQGDRLVSIKGTILPDVNAAPSSSKTISVVNVEPQAQKKKGFFKRLFRRKKKDQKPDQNKAPKQEPNQDQ